MSDENTEVKTEASAEVTETQEANKKTSDNNTVKLAGVYAYKVGMSSVYDDEGNIIPVTVLKFDPWIVSQVKTNEKEGYSAVQMASMPRRAANSTKALSKHLNKAGFENSARYVRELRLDNVEGVSVGMRVDIESLVKGDKVQISGKTKGRGFSGVIKRWGFAGGPATHGSGFHRRPGSIGNCTFPGRVMKGRKMPGQYGNHTHNLPRVNVVEVMPEEGVILVKGPVPGSKNSLIKLMKV